MTTPEPTLRERLGGRWVTSWPVYWLAVIVVAITTASIEPQSLAYGRNVWRWLLVFLASAAVLGVMFLLARFTVFRNAARSPVPVWVTVAFGMLISLARSLTVQAVMPALGLPGFARPALRIVGGMVTTPVLLLMVVALVGELERRRQANRDLRTRLMEVRATDVEREELVQAMTDRVYGEVIEATAGARADLDAPYDAMDPEERMQVAARLRRVVVDDLRPLSHRLDSATEAPLPDISLRSAMGRAWHDDPLEPAASGVVVAVMSLPFQQVDFGAWSVPLLVALHGVLVWAALKTAQVLARRGGFLRRNQMAVGIVLAIVLTELRIGLVATAVGESPGIRILGNAIWVAVLILLTSAVAAVLRGERMVGAQLGQVVDRRAVDAAVADRELVRVSRDIAQYVHGTLQGTLLATAFAIEDATRRGDDAALAQALDQARRALDAAPMPTSAATTLAAEVEDRAAMWRGFTDVRVQVDPALGDVPPGVIADVGRVVEEAIGNAHKHGPAGRVEVRVAPAGGGGLRVQVSDDGPGPGNGVNGMGFTWLDFAAPGAWRLEKGGVYGGSVLTVDLPQAA